MLEDRTLLAADFSQLPGAFTNTLLPKMQNAVNSDVYQSTSIPLLGSALQGKPTGTQFLTDMTTVLTNDIKNPSSATDVVTDFNQVFKDLKLAGNSTINDDTSNPDDVKFTVTMVSQQINIPALPLSLGLGSLGLSLPNVNISAGLQYTVNFDFGVTDSDAYLSTTRSPNIQFSLSLPLTLPQMPSFTFGPLQITLGPLTTPSLTFAVAFAAPHNNQIFVKQDIGGGYDLTAHSALSLPSQQDLNFSLPFSLTTNGFISVSTTLALDWPLSVQNDQISVSNPTLSLNDITLDLTPFTDPKGVLGSIANDINQVVGKLDPVASLLQEQIPVLSQISGAISAVVPNFPSQNLTMATLFDYVYDASQNSSAKPAEDFLGLYNLLKAIGGLFTPEGAQIDFGSYSFGTYGGADLSTLIPTHQVSALGDVATQIANNIGMVINDINSALNSVFQDLNQDEGNQKIQLTATISLPIFDANNAVQNMLSLIEGKNVNLFQFEFDATWSYSDHLPFIPILGPLGLQIDAGLELDAKLVMGFDTFGLTENKPNLPDCFYIDPSTDVKLTGKVTADAAVNLPLVELGGGGGITGVLDFPINTDPAIVGPLLGTPQEVRLSNIQTALGHGPLCIFDPKGSLTVSLNVFAKIGVDPFSVTLSKDLGSQTIASFCLGCSTVPQTMPVLAGAGNWTYDSSTNTFNPVNGPGELVLDMGPFAADRGLKVWNGQGWQGNLSDTADESFSVSAVPNQPIQQGVESVDISSSGFTERYTGVTAIFADGGDGNDTISVAPDVMVPVELHAGAKGLINAKDLLQAGGGTAVLYGAESSQGYPAMDTLIAGSSTSDTNVIQTPGKGFGNYLFGGDYSNGLLEGASGTDYFQAGATSAGIIQRLVAGQGNDFAAGHCCGEVDFVAGAGSDTFAGGDDANIYVWQEGDGPLVIHGGTGLYASNSLEAATFSTGSSFVVKPGALSPLEVDIFIPSGQANSLNETIINADTVQSVSVDGLGDGGKYLIKYLGGTGVQSVAANLHEVSGGQGAADAITILGASSAPNTVDIRANPQELAGNTYDAQGNPGPNVYGPATDVNISVPGSDIGAVELPPVSYEVKAAIPKTSDMLDVTTGTAADTVNIHSTQPSGKVNVDTGGGDDSITVGGSPTWLDYFLGPLNIQAGSGHNQITFDESQSYISDTVTLTASQLIRYTQPPEADHFDADGNLVKEFAYPLIINYAATGGDFANGVFFDTSYGSTNLYVPATGSNAPTTVTAFGAYLGTHDSLFLGLGATIPPGQGPLLNGLSLSPTTVAASTLDFFSSPLTVLGNGPTYLEADDEGALTGQTYTIGTLAPSVGYLQRTTVSAISYQNLNLTLNAANQQNQIFVPAVAVSTTATINTGTASNSVLVGNSILPPLPLYVLNSIQGALAINGGGGSNDLALNDGFNIAPFTYQLSATTMQRLGGLSIAPISFSKMTTMELYESPTANNITNVTGTPLGTTVTVFTGTGTDGLTVTGLDQVQGPLDFVWTSGTKSLVVDDSTAAGNDTYTLSATELDRTGAASVQFDPGISILELFASLSENLLARMDAIPSNTTVKVFAGKGADSIVAGGSGNKLDPIQGTLFVQGGGNTTLYLEDKNSGKARGYDFESTSVTTANVGQFQFANLTGLVLDASSAGSNNEYVNDTAAGNQVTINAGQNDLAQVGFASLNLLGIQGTLDVVGTGPGVSLELIDSSGISFTNYVLSASQEQSFFLGNNQPLSSPIEYQGLQLLDLFGSTNNDVYTVQSLPALTGIQLGASGASNTLFGPSTDNIWQFKRVGQLVQYILDGTASFVGMQMLEGGSGADDFQFVGTGFTGAIDGRSGTDALDFSQLGGPVSVTLTQDGNIDGVNGTASALGGTFSNIESLIGSSPGSTLDGSAYNSDFTHTMTAAGFDSMNMHVFGNLSGSLLAPTEGTAANPISSIAVSGSVAAGAKIKVNFLKTFFVGANMSGTLKGFGTNAGTSTIAHITVVGDFLSPGLIQAPTFGTVSVHNFGGVLSETMPTQDFQEIDIGGSLLASGVISAPTGQTLNIAGDLAGTVTITGALGSLYVGGNLTGSVSAAIIGSVTIVGTNTGQVQGYQSIIVLDPTAGGALSLSGNGSINIPGSVYVDSNSSTALSAGGNASVKAASIQVVGNVHKSGNATLSPAPVIGAASMPNPLAGLSGLSTSGMTNYGAVKISGNSTQTLNPGIYSQITISGNASVTFSAGVYLIEGGGFKVSGNASVKGTGVTIYNAGSNYPNSGGTYGAISLGGNSTVNLIAPTTGPYAGLVLIQDSADPKAVAISGNAAGMLGILDAPSTQLQLSGNASLKAGIVVDMLTVSGNSIANIVSPNASKGATVYTPAEIRSAYGINNLSLDGTGQTLAIVDAYDDPSIFAALDAFDSLFGLTNSGPTLYAQYGPATSFLTVMNQYGQTTSLPPTDPAGAGNDNWEVEIALDVEWAHAIAPGAQIILVEANSQALSDLMAGVATAAGQPGVSVVSMSFGYAEGLGVFAADEAAYDSTFTTPGVTFVGSTGDHGAAYAVYPAFSPNVLAVGGTSLNLNADSSYNSETGWGYVSTSAGAFIGGGGGISQFETEPAYQLGVQSTGFRTTPDVSFVADPATGAWVADPYNLDPSNPWEVVGGTSLSAPSWGGLIALVNQGRAAAGVPALNSSSPTQAQQALYSLSQGDYNVITSGYNGYTAGPGYNLVTGLGTPIANVLVPDLTAGNFPASGQVAPITAAGLVYSAPSGDSAGGVAQAMNVFTAITGTRGRGQESDVSSQWSLVSGQWAAAWGLGRGAWSDERQDTAHGSRLTPHALVDGPQDLDTGLLQSLRARNVNTELVPFYTAKPQPAAVDHVFADGVNLEWFRI